MVLFFLVTSLCGMEDSCWLTLARGHEKAAAYCYSQLKSGTTDELFNTGCNLLYNRPDQASTYFERVARNSNPELRAYARLFLGQISLLGLYGPINYAVAQAYFSSVLKNPPALRVKQVSHYKM